MKIREMQQSEYPLLESFLYEAVFVSNGVEPPPKSIIYRPELQVYISKFGKNEHDIAFVADMDGKIVGAVWVRIMDDYGLARYYYAYFDHSRHIPIIFTYISKQLSTIC